MIKHTILICLSKNKSKFLHHVLLLFCEPKNTVTTYENKYYQQNFTFNFQKIKCSNGKVFNYAVETYFINCN